jgi:hypothetical protein
MSTILQLCVLYTVLLSQLWYLLTKLIGKLHIVLSGCTFTSVMVLVHKIDLKTPYCIFKLQYSFLARAVTIFGQLWIIKYEARNFFGKWRWSSRQSRILNLASTTPTAVGKCAYMPQRCPIFNNSILFYLKKMRRVVVFSYGVLTCKFILNFKCQDDHRQLHDFEMCTHC